ncbi:DEAD/DEAH box helicase [Fodinisporobacter ferrooxydans]|uniref:DNA 5'-3' helicase n=1 Tax=Fodinisporobacter ferrooxydans TaxID=2901836 RepID=A0ABY4CI45_9BACL|nr:DEAD/DEAH box helicase [Alicyclobacillaceae bacterium MYW30-H2]
MLDCYSVLIWQEPMARDAQTEHWTFTVGIVKQEQIVEQCSFSEHHGDASQFLKMTQQYPMVTACDLEMIHMIRTWCEDEGYTFPSNAFIHLPTVAAYVWPAMQFQSFSDVVEQLQRSHSLNPEHLDEADIVINVFQMIQHTIAEWPYLLLQQIMELSSMVDSGYHLVVQTIFQKTSSLTHLQAPEGRQIIQQLLFRERVIQEKTERESVPFVVSDCLDSMAADGPMKQLFPSYQPRQGQLEMLHQVALALNDGQHLIVEAGTGTGKSLAYLIPAAQFAASSDEKVIVATHTIHLQTQLLERDVPLVEQLLQLPVQFAVLKGRNNYVCMRKVATSLNTLGLLSDKNIAAFLMKMLVWLKDTPAGDREELPLSFDGQELWAQIQSEAETCINKKCPWFKYCYYHRAKAAASGADVVITNHSLVLTDLKADHNILPGYDHLIFDEAHHLEDGATKHLGTEIHYYRVMGILNRLHKDGKTGQLPLLKQTFTRVFHTEPERMAAWTNKIDSVMQDCLTLRQATEEMFDLLSQFVASHTGSSDGGRSVLRIRANDRKEESWQPIGLSFDNFQVTLQSLRKHIKGLEAGLEDLESEELEGMIEDAIGLAKEVDRIWEDMTNFYQATDENTVTWIEREDRGHKGIVGIYTAPIDVGPLLDQMLFSKKQSIILTSATFTVNKGFQHAVQRLGLLRSQKEEELQTLTVESPFRYSEQALLCVPTDMPGMTEEPELFIRELCDTLVKLGRISKGRMLVLFTSYKMMHEVYKQSFDAFQQFGIALFAQGINSSNRHHLIQTFKNHEQAVLFGTSSFWEGVDIPGEQLSCLAIVRLPFWPPNHPVIEARTELLKAKGHNAFSEYAVPQAIVRFKQGFGRLVRSTQDVGAVVVFDRRIVDSSYGKRFIQSLPKPRMFQGTRREIYAAVYHWLRP